MKGTITDFLKLAIEKEELAKELHELAARYDFEFLPPGELSEDELGDVAGGVSVEGVASSVLKETYGDAESGLKTLAEEMGAMNAAKSKQRALVDQLRQFVNG